MSANADIEALADALLALHGRAARLAEAAKLLIESPQAILKGLRVDSERAAAPGALTVRLSLQVPVEVLDLVAAMRAGDGELRRIETQIRHVFSSSGVFGETEEARVGEGGQIALADEAPAGEAPR